MKPSIPKITETIKNNEVFNNLTSGPSGSTVNENPSLGSLIVGIVIMDYD